ncbi:MAG: hypothetical protein V1874_09245 [Spirochaetota bacterium]
MIERVNIFLERLVDRLAVQLDLIEYCIVSGSWIRYRNGLETLKPNDVDVLLIGKDAANLVTPKLEIADICKETGGIYIFSDFVSQPPVETLSKRIYDDPTGIHLYYYADFKQAIGAISPSLFISLMRDSDVLYGNREKLEQLVPRIEKQASLLAFGKRLRLPALIEQWYSLMLLGNEHLEADAFGREMLFEYYRKFARYMTKYVLIEVLREHGVEAASGNWNDISAAVMKSKQQIRILNIEQYLKVLCELFDSASKLGPKDISLVKEMFIKSLRLYESALKCYGTNSPVS